MISFGLKEKTGDVYVHWFRVGSSKITYYHSSFDNVGYNVVENAWVSLGYNLTGFEDKDFSHEEFTAQWPFVRFRFKFDQNSVHDAAKWLNGN